MQKRCFGKQRKAKGRLGLARKRSNGGALIAAFPKPAADMISAPKDIVVRKLRVQHGEANVDSGGHNSTSLKEHIRERYNGMG